MKERVKKTIEKLDDDLSGVAFSNGKKYVIDKTLPGEEVLAEVVRTSGNAVVCNLKKVLSPSEKRIKLKCAYFNECGGCELLMTSYKEQLNIKTALVKRKFSALGFSNIDDCVACKDTAPRNKVHICFESEDGYIRAGFFNDETHKVIDIEDCIMNGQWYHDLVKILIAFIKSANISIYCPKAGKGVLRFAVARKNEVGIMLTLVVTREEKCDYSGLYNRLTKRFGEVALFINVNDRKTNEVLSEKFIHILGNKTLSGEIAGIKYEISPNSFMQTNHKMAERIYLDILEKTKDDENIVDLFSGIGITSVLFSKNGKNVESVEIVESSVQNAKTIAKLNEVESIRFYRGDCKDVLLKLKIADKTLFVDPPRAGLTKDVVDIILEAEPKKIIYLSCSLKTLVDDLKSLTTKYTIQSVTPYDMFPGTKHVETLVVLNKEDK